MDDRVAGISFDAQGVCSHCRIHDHLEKLFPLGATGKQILLDMAKGMQKDGRGKAYDCIVGLSGGRDTSYCLYYAKEVLGLRPLAVHFDNGWTSDIARGNMQRICERLEVDLQVITMDWEDSKELTNATMRACVPYLDLTNDIGIARTLYDMACKHKIRYILLSHSFREEGITPLLWNYMDGRFTRAIIRRFARKKITHFKNADLHDFLYWILFKRIKVVNVTNYYDDMGDSVETMLTERFGWEEPGGHHMDNELFILIYYYALKKFNIDWRIVEVSAKVRAGTLTREEGLAIMDSIAYFDNKELASRALQKQGVSEEEFEEILKKPNKYFTDYPNYYSWIKIFRPVFKLLCRTHILPAHAYEKYFKVF
jgi:hypothetical protein